MSAIDEIGPVHYVLQVPGLAFDHYMKMQRTLIRPSRDAGRHGGTPVQQQPTRLRRAWRWFLGTLPWWLIGGLAGYLASSELGGIGLWISLEDTDLGWSISLAGVIGIAFGLVLLTLLASVLVAQVFQRKLLRRLHAAGSGIFGAHELVFGRDGILWRNASRCLIVPWSQVTRLAPGPEMLVIVADQISGFWLQEGVLAALPDRAAFMTYLGERIAGNLPAKEEVS